MISEYPSVTADDDLAAVANALIRERFVPAFKLQKVHGGTKMLMQNPLFLKLTMHEQDVSSRLTACGFALEVDKLEGYAIALAYEHAEAVAPSERAALLAATVDANLESSSVPWIRSWALGFRRSAVSDPMSVCSSWDGREEDLQDLVSMMREYDALGAGAFVSQRMFSVECFGDSKKLERSVGKDFI